VRNEKPVSGQGRSALALVFRSITLEFETYLSEKWSELGGGI
jgi:hypothetical protein